MSKAKEVLLFLTDQWADWEASHAIVGISFCEQYVVKTIGIDKQPKVSIGGIRAEIDYSIEDYQNIDNLAMIILTGSFSWEETCNDVIADFLRKINKKDIPIAAICGATIFLAKHGFLNNIKHTGDELEYFEEMLENEDDYKGHEHFSVKQVINDGGFITANETAALEFAREIFLTLKTDTDEEINSWYEKQKHGLHNNDALN
ncbi:MAG: DJ-1/PfpI family protein [Defluviitaleaceae bacterium]|nr:DJ-1/PfpI family protein [Defluviitaleaceae bacterium]